MMLHRCIRALTVLTIFYLPVFAQVTVSILTFENSDSTKKDHFLDKSITEMVTVDLVGVQGITIIERSDIEKIFQEQAMALSGALDESSIPQIGKLLGAHYLIFGTYSVKRQNIDVRYKITEVETGAIRQAGAASGRLRRIMQLKNTLVGSIYRSLRSVVAGLGPYAFPPDEELVTVEDAEEFGKALDYADKENYEKAGAILRGFSGRGVHFSYAQRSLQQLEKRLQNYGNEHERRIDRTAGGPLTYVNFLKTVTGYFSTVQYSKCLEYCRSVRNHLPKAPVGGMVTTEEMCDYYMVASFNAMGTGDSTILYGEKFLREYTESMYFLGVREMIKTAITVMEEQNGPSEESLRKIGGMITQASLLAGEEAILEYFKIANELFIIKQWGRALDWYRRIDPSKLPVGIEGDLIAYQVFMCYYSLKDSKEATKMFEFIKTRYPGSRFIGAMRQLVDMIPE